MEYKVELGKEKEFIYAFAKGEWDSEVDNALVKEIMNMVEEEGILKVLLDIRELQFNHSILQMFLRVQEMREKRRAKRRATGKTSRRVAIVYSDTLPVEGTFFETASQNRGLPYWVFSDIEKAKEWLLMGSQ